MRNKSVVLLGALISLASTNTFKAESVTATSKCSGGCYPTFVENYIKLSTGGSLCGGLNITPKKGNVQVQAQVFSQPLFGSQWDPGKITSKDSRTGSAWVDLPPGGFRVRYDWAGGRPSFHYRIFCQTTTYGAPQLVPCKDYVDISSIKHNVGCVIGPLGPEADYAPLNMNES